MHFNQTVEQLLHEALEADKALFLIDFNIDAENKIKVVVDSDNGLLVSDIVRISRHIEHNLDKDTYDFGLDVASPGATSDLKIPRQFIKNIGRTLKITTHSDETLEGELTQANETGIVLEWSSREQKTIGKGKQTVQHERSIPYDQINKANVIIQF